MSKQSESLPLSDSDLSILNIFLTYIGILTSMVLPMIVLFLGGNTITRESALRTYVEMLVSLFLLFLAFFLLGDRINKKYPEVTARFSSAYVTLMMPLICLLITLTVTGRSSLSRYPEIVGLLYLVFILLWWFGRKGILVTLVYKNINSWIVNLSPLAYSLIFWVWFYVKYRPTAGLRSVVILIVAIIGAILYLRILALQKINLHIRSHWWIYILLGLLLIGLIYQPELPVDRLHYNFFLAPVNDVLHGKMLFVNSTSQYGVGAIYLIAAIYRIFHFPIYYAGLSLIVDVLFILQYVALFLMLQKMTRSFFLSLAGISAIVYFNYLAVTWPSMLRIPAQSPIRYGLTYVLLWVAVSGVDGSNKPRLILEYVLLGLCSIWSLETFLFTMFSLDAFYFVKDILYGSQLRIGIIGFCKRIALQLGMIALSWGVFLAVTYMISGQVPNPFYYLDYFINYTIAERYSHIIDFRSFWTGVVTTIYLISIFFVVFIRFKRKECLSTAMSSILVGMSVAGLLQYSYYFVYDIDYHLALLCVPLIFVLILWLAVLLNISPLQRLLPSLRLSFCLALIISLWICMISFNPRFHSIIKKSLIYEITSNLISGEGINFTNPYWVEPSDESVKALVTMIRKYAPGENQIAIFAQPDDEVETLLIVDKTHLLDISDPDMSSISPTYSAFVLNQAKEVAGQNDFIFYDSRDGTLVDLQQEAFRVLITANPYVVIDQSGSIVVLKKSGDR